MESKRQQQLGHDIQRIIAMGFNNELRDLLLGAFVTVSDVNLTPDLLIARARITVFQKEKENEVLESLRENVSRVRGLVGNQMRNKVRLIPHIEFYLDHSLEKVFEIERLLRGKSAYDNEEE